MKRLFLEAPGVVLGLSLLVATPPTVAVRGGVDARER